MAKQASKDRKEVKLGDIVDINSKSIGKDFSYDEIKYIDISSVGTGDFLGFTKYNISDAPSRAKRLLKNGDIILSTVRPNRRSFLFIKDPEENRVASTGFAVLSAKEGVDKGFIYYIVNQQSFTDYLTNNAKGAAYPAIDTETIERADVSLPPLPTQQRIASILSTYDYLIENNTRRIKILEEQAQLIYKERFVKFKFPGWERVKMVESETEFGKIPEGWELNKVGNILKTIKRKPKVSAGEYLEKGSIPVIDQGRGEIAGYVNDVKYLQDDHLPMVVFGDHTRILKYVDSPFASGADGTQLLYPNNEKLLPVCFYMILKNIDLKSELYARHFKFLKEKFVIVPEENILKEYNVLCEPMFEEISNLQKQNQNLKETRDMLIPKLVSGEVEV